MATAGRILDMPAQMDYYVGLMAKAKRNSAIIEAVQGYLASWSSERVANVQKIDAGWAPFDANQRPLPVHGPLDVRCIRDAIHCHCMALRDAGVALTLELVELDEFFFVANEMAENHGRVASRARMPATSAHIDVSANL
jgi:hypothetical protein